MKELSIEEKAKRYDEILARATGAYLPYYTEDIMTKVREFVEYLLPELKEESEDERIRKAVIDAVETLSDSPLKVKMLAWLEKQGEKKYVDKVEPKLAWSEENYDVMINKLLAVVNLYYDRSGNDLDKQSCISFLKSLKDRVQPQPQQQWSEEDEDIKDSIIHQLKMLRGDRNVTEGNKKEIDWLKSLRPQSTWRPSDKQMVALDGICSYIRNKADWEISQDMVSDLYKLSEQLKKLKG